MALPFLPEDEIAPMFHQLQNFVTYVSDTWITGSTWPPSSWSVYKQAIRTNNDIEGWHNALNRRASGKCQLPFYMLINLLQKEARLTSLQIRLVSERKIKRIQRKKYRSLQAQIFDLWGKYEDGVKSATQLLHACSHLNGSIIHQI